MQTAFKPMSPDRNLTVVAKINSHGDLLSEQDLHQICKQTQPTFKMRRSRSAFKAEKCLGCSMLTLVSVLKVFAIGSLPPKLRIKAQIKIRFSSLQLTKILGKKYH